ncbi:MAG: glycogen debranching enzyme family protein [Planctomycetes bacterium]|nr:glycogen debranching enzyme family protein [Planctomycetota bacterium]
MTNGRGGYAMAAVNQMLTRRYHGLLVAAVNPPVERYVLLAKLEATAIVGGLTYELATNDYPEAVHPHGYRLLESFSPRPRATWRWRVGEALIEQTLWMIPGEDSTAVQYRLVEGESAVPISIRPLCTSRHFHHLLNYRDLGPPTVEEIADGFRLAWSAGRPAWQLSFNAEFKSRPDWYYQFVLREEAVRGYDSTQDLFMPGLISAELRRDDPKGLVIVASTQSRTWREAMTRTETPSGLVLDSRRIGTHISNALHSALTSATADFVVARGAAGKTVIAGYPWFGDWGRDTFISLPGLCLVTGRQADARAIIAAFSEHVREGMIPNRFPDYGEAPAYNTVDATLWYIHAIDRYLAYTGDWAFIADKILPVVADILDAHQRGTRHNIRVDSDGLLSAGEHGFALTWMDAKLPDHTVTPRIGKPVEVNALWFNALRIAASFADRAGDVARATEWSSAAERCAAGFNARFWNAARGCLYDVVDVEGRTGENDDRIRPNQLLAISLTHPVLERRRWRDVVDVCQRDLWTPMGLRTLAPTEPGYRPRYDGDMAQRDTAYHQGTVWPWLLGPFVSAYTRAYGSTPQARATAQSFLDGLSAHLKEAGIGGVSEVADAEAPHRSNGCPWQAWSVAEPLRALHEDVLMLNTAPAIHQAAHRAEPISAAPQTAQQ